MVRCSKSLDRTIYDTKLPTQIIFPSYIFYLSYHFNFSFDPQRLLLFVTVAMLSIVP